MGRQGGSCSVLPGLIDFVPETGSTNADLALRLRCGEGLAEGYWLVADRQSAGRGRQGREWFDAGGNFMGSMIVRLGKGDPLPGSLAFVAGLAVYEAVLPLLADPSRLLLKWPNDLLLAGAKLSGILMEREGDALIVGIGVNLASAPQLPDRKTIALSDLGVAPSRDDFAGKIAIAMTAELERWRAYGMAPLLSRWLAAAHPEGTPLLVQEPGAEPVNGTFAGLEADGALRLRLADGTTRAIHAADVTA